MLKSPTSECVRPLLDALNMIAGIALALSPWYLGYFDESYAAWTADAAIAGGILVTFHRYAQRVTAASYRPPAASRQLG